MKIREPFFAHQGWYPASESGCRSAVDDYLGSFPGSPTATTAGIVPHAGWVYSGRLAGWTYAALAESRPDVVFVFGGHMHPGQRCVCMPEGAFGTPLGPVPIQVELAGELVSRFGCEREHPSSARPDNTIELQMPFIRSVWPRASVVAAQIPPDDTAEEAGAWAAGIAADRGLSAVAIGSTDLTHYGANYGFTPRGSGDEAHRWSKEVNDRPFLDRLLSLDIHGAIEHALENHSACCAGAAAAAAAFARARGAKQGQLIDHRTSHEIEGHGSPRMWVGYASAVF